MEGVRHNEACRLPGVLRPDVTKIPLFPFAAIQSPEAILYVPFSYEDDGLVSRFCKRVYDPFQ